MRESRDCKQKKKQKYLKSCSTSSWVRKWKLTTKWRYFHPFKLSERVITYSNDESVRNQHSLHFQFSSVQLLSRVWCFVTPRITARQASLSITKFWRPTKPMSIESVMPSSHLILCPSPSPPAPNPSQHQGLFQWVNSSHEVAKVLEFQLQHQSFQWAPRTDLL